MLRTELASDHGMAFVFPDEELCWFWMKNTLIPLDILYFDGSRWLVSVQVGAGQCKTALPQLCEQPARTLCMGDSGRNRREDRRDGGR